MYHSKSIDILNQTCDILQQIYSLDKLNQTCDISQQTYSLDKLNQTCDISQQSYRYIESNLVIYHSKPIDTVKTLHNVTRYNRIFNIRYKMAGNGSVSIKISSL